MKKIQRESAIQSSFFKYINLFKKKYRPYCFAIPNGGSRHALEALRLQREGVTPGVPDVFCAIARDPYHGLFIEFKAGKNRLTSHQKLMIETLKSEGYRCEVCYQLEEAIKIFENYTRNA